MARHRILLALGAIVLSLAAQSSTQEARYRVAFSGDARLKGVLRQSDTGTVLRVSGGGGPARSQSPRVLRVGEIPVVQLAASQLPHQGRKHQPGSGHVGSDWWRWWCDDRNGISGMETALRYFFRDTVPIALIKSPKS